MSPVAEKGPASPPPTQQLAAGGNSALLIASLLDEDNPVGLPLTAKFRRGFGFKTISHRLPVILTKVIDQLSRDKNQIGSILGPEARDDVKLVVGAIAKLKNEMQTNKSLPPVGNPVWDKYLEQVAVKYNDGKVENVKWFFAPWLFVECYMYRRLKDAFLHTERLKEYDPFRKQKEDGWNDSVGPGTVLGEYVLKSIGDFNAKEGDHKGRKESREILQKLMELSLWGNRCDLSISVGESNSQTTNLVGQLVSLKPSILADESEKFWESLDGARKDGGGEISVGYVLDNSGFELFTDFCFADGLISTGDADRVDFHFKNMPWFVSDALLDDAKWLLDVMGEAAEDNEVLGKLAARWKSYLTQGKWRLIENQFWTYPHSYSEMAEADPSLYSLLKGHTALIFKGDLNYRKLIGDINWLPQTPFVESLRGFLPAPLVALRTLKADCIAGLRPGLAEEISLSNPDWLVTGEFGVIQFASPLS